MQSVRSYHDYVTYLQHTKYLLKYIFSPISTSNFTHYEIQTVIIEITNGGKLF